MKYCGVCSGVLVFFRGMSIYVYGCRPCNPGAAAPRPRPVARLGQAITPPTQPLGHDPIGTDCASDDHVRNPSTQRLPIPRPNDKCPSDRSSPLPLR